MISVWPTYGFRIISMWFRMKTVWGEYGDSIPTVSTQHGKGIATAYLTYPRIIRIVCCKYWLTEKNLPGDDNSVCIEANIEEVIKNWP